MCLLGPWQVGKTPLARELAQQVGGLHLDPESDSDRAKLTAPESHLALQLDKLLVLDEVYRLSSVFQPLRGLVDRACGTAEDRPLPVARLGGARPAPPIG